MSKILVTAGEPAIAIINFANSTPKSLKQQLAKAEKDLKNMTNRKVDGTVLHQVGYRGIGGVLIIIKTICLK